MIDPYLQSPRALVVLMIVSMAVVGAAMASEYFGGLNPCLLCHYQRVPYYAVAVIALTAILFPKVTTDALIIMAITFVIGGGIGVFHVGVEQGWWEGTRGCVGDAPASQSLDDLRAQIMAAPIVRCNEIQWSLFGITMAGYNVLASLGLTVFAVMAAWRSRKR